MIDVFTCNPASEDPSGGGLTEAGLGEVLAGLRLSREVTHNIRYNGRIRHLPSRRALEQVLVHLSAVLFPSHYGQTDLTDETVDAFVAAQLTDAVRLLNEQVRRDILSSPRYDVLTPAEVNARAASVVASFARQLPAIRGLVVSDLMAAYAGDPAATGYPEIMLGYPGMIAVLNHRIAHALYRLDATLLARLVSQIAHSRTAIDIHPGATVGHSFFIDHGTGVVIGETAVIGDRVRLYQAVTLGAKRFQADEDGMLVKGIERHPIVEDDVVIYAGATILGRIRIGHGSVIGGNVWLTQSVPPLSSITQASLRRAEPQPSAQQGHGAEPER